MSRFLFKWLSQMLAHQGRPRRKYLRSPVQKRSALSQVSIESLEDRHLLSGGIAEFRLPMADSWPNEITAAPDGNLWFTGFNLDYNRVGHICTGGHIVGETLIPPPSRPDGIVVGPDADLWFTEEAGNNIGRMNLDGVVTDGFPLPVQTPSLITVGPDDNLWFTGDGSNYVARFELQSPHTITSFAVPGDPYGITSGPDGNLWVVAYGSDDGSSIWRVNPWTGALTPFTLPSGSGPTHIISGPDGSLWFTEEYANQIGRLTPIGTDEEIQESITELTVPTANSHPYDITTGPDGNIWFTEAVRGVSRIGRVTTSGNIAEFEVPTRDSEPRGITTGPDGNIWFTEYSANQIGKLYVLTASGVTLGEAVTAGQPLDAVVANFHDDEPGMLGSNYQVSIDWGDGTSGGQAWIAGGGHWVATGSHTYADPGHYDITVTITDMNGPNGMTATAYSSVDVGPAASSGNAGRRSGFVAFADVASALATTPRPAPSLAVVSPAADLSPPVTRQVNESPANSPPRLSESGGLAVAAATLRPDTGVTVWAEPPAWLDLASLDLLARNLLA